jgi:hypothetical protein
MMLATFNIINRKLSDYLTKKIQYIIENLLKFNEI